MKAKAMDEMVRRRHLVCMAVFIAACAPLMAFGILYLLDRRLMEPLVTTPLGWAAIGAVLLLESVGYLFIRKIVSVEI